MSSRRQIPLNTLRAFEAVGRHCHVRNAADELCLTHAALSRQVRILEEQLGTTLFNRQSKRLTLNSAGKRFLSVVQDALERLHEGMLYLDPNSMAGEVVIATTPSLSLNWLTDIIGQFCQRYTEIEPRLITIQPHQRKLPPEFDIAICLGQPDVDSHQVTRLYLESYFPVCSPSLLNPEKPIKCAADLLKYPILHERLNHWQSWCDLAQLPNYKGTSNIYFDYGFQMIEAARRGFGIGLADQLEVAKDLQDGNLVRLLDMALPIDESIYLVTEPETSQNVRARLFVEHLYKNMNDLGIKID
jgi:LysR family transcriptional regulator, glycine cleavage system transcriptional activator